MPSTKALSPPTKNGTSAPSGRPDASRRSRGQSQPPQAGSSASSVVAASELPPPSPARPRHALVDRDVGAERGAALGLQRAARRRAQVVGRQRQAQVVALQRGRRCGARSARCRPSRSARTPTAAGGSRRRAGRPRAGTGSAWPAPAGRRERASSWLTDPASRAPTVPARAHAPPAPSRRRIAPGRCASRVARSRSAVASARRAGPRPAAQPVEQCGQRQRLAEQVQRQRVEVGELACALAGDQVGTARAPVRLASVVPSGGGQLQRAGAGVAAQFERLDTLRVGTPSWASTRTRQPPGEAQVAGRRRRRAAGQQRQRAHAAAAAPTAADHRLDLQPRQRLAQHLVGGVAAAPFAPDAARLVARPLTHSTSPRWAAISGSGRAA